MYFSNWTLRDAKVRAIAAAAPQLDLAFVHQRPYFRPKACGTLVPREELWDFLWGQLPERSRHSDPSVIWSSKDGWSWKMLLKAMVNQPNLIIMCKTKESGTVFGAILVKGFEKASENKYLPDREAIVFTLNEPKAYQWNFGNPDYVGFWSQDRICIGCDDQGNNAIVLEPELETVQLGKCAVFRNPLLAEKERIMLVALEVYKFA